MPKTRESQLLTRIHPLHPVRKGIVRDQVVSPPSWIRDDRVCLDQRRCQRRDDG